MPIIQSISRFLQTLQMPFTTASNINRQKNFIRKKIDPLFAEAKKTDHGSLDENVLNKINGYYALVVPSILGEGFCVLRGMPMTGKERRAISSLATMTGLADDFFNPQGPVGRQSFSEQSLKHLSEKPELFTINTAGDKLFLDLYKTALANATQPALVQEQFFKMGYALLPGKQQDGPGLSYEIIKDNSMRKGAEFMLFYRTAFYHPFKKGEEKMLYGLGGLIQLSTDIYNVGQDHKKGINNLVTTATKIQELRFHYSALLQIITEAVFKSGYPRKNNRKFMGILNAGIFSPCFVWLDHLEKIEKGSGGIFNLNACSKKDLTNKMDYRLKSLRYYFKLSRRLR